MKKQALALVGATAAIALVGVAGCGDSGTSDTSTPEGTPAQGTLNQADAVEGGTLRAGINDNPDHLDPGLSYTSEGWEILEATNNGLLTLKKEAGAAGNEVVPDIAEAMPKVTDGGKTYTFKVRDDVMFSDPVNRAVRPSDFKDSIERLFRINSGGLSFYTGIVGAEEYAKTRKGDISGIEADDKAGTITFHLTEPDGAFPEYLAVPFAYVLPAGTPDKDISTIDSARVATGPYMISSYTPKQSVELVRNPSFKEWTQDSPDGHLDGINITIGVSPDAAVNETVQGDLDWYFTTVPPARLTELQGEVPRPGLRQHAQQRHVLLHERAQAPVRRSQGAPGAQLRDRPRRAREAVRRPGRRRPRTSSRRAWRRPTRSTTSIPTTSTRPSSWSRSPGPPE